MNLHEQARAEAEKRWPGDSQWWARSREFWADGFLAGHEAATRTRVVTTVTELDALPVGSVVLSEYGVVWERESDVYWIETGITWQVKSTDVAVPARVLYDPEEDPRA